MAITDKEAAPRRTSLESRGAPRFTRTSRGATRFYANIAWGIALYANSTFRFPNFFFSTQNLNPTCASRPIFSQLRDNAPPMTSKPGQSSTRQIPLIGSEPLNWSSAIGLFILNYGVLDWHVFVFLESKLSPQEFAATKKMHLHDRIARVKDLVGGNDCSAETKQAFETFLRSLDPIRELRNHIAHGHLLTRLSNDGNVSIMTLSLPKNLDAIDNPETRHLSFAELTKALSALTDLIEEFGKLSGFHA